MNTLPVHSSGRLPRSKRLAAAFFILSAAVTSACGGGGKSTPAVNPTTAPLSNVHFSILIPITQSSSRKPAYLSAKTQSIAVQLATVAPAGPGPAVIIDLAAGSSDCSATACSADLMAPVGQDQFVVTAYDGPGASGHVLSTGAITITVTPASTSANLSNSLSLTLNGVVSSISLAVTPSVLAANASSAVTVTVTAYDASGAIIVGPGNYNTPVTITVTDPANLTSGLSGTLTYYGQALVGSYSAGALTVAPAGELVVLSASAPGTQTVSATLTISPVFATPSPTPVPTPTGIVTLPPTPTPSPTPTPTPSPTPTAVPAFNVTPNAIVFNGPSPQPAQTITASEFGFTNFSATSSDTTIATVSGSGAIFTVNAAQNSGVATITVSDPQGRTAGVSVTVSGVRIIIQSRKKH